MTTAFDDLWSNVLLRADEGVGPEVGDARTRINKNGLDVSLTRYQFHAEGRNERGPLSQHSRHSVHPA